MTTQDLTCRTDANPFATRYTEPGRIRYLFPMHDSAERMVDQLAQQGWWGQIVGPHGAGKSTLLAALLPVCELRGRQIIRYNLHDRQRRLPRNTAPAINWSNNTLLVVDGYEQLAWPARWKLRLECRIRGAGLLVTAHQDQAGIPRLSTVEPHAATFVTIVRGLLATVAPSVTLADECIHEAFHRHHGNQREALMSLYDVFQRQAVSSAQRTP